MARRIKRPYVKSQRAEQEAETRDRIVEAVLALHEEVGPLRTSIKSIAERAGVQRLTVYRHFPGQREIIAACSSRWGERFPPPDLDAIEPAGPPRARTRALLVALYRYYASAAPMLEKVLPDAPYMPEVREALAPFGDYLERFVTELERAWPRKSSRRRATLLHALQFDSWRSLTRITGGDSAAVDLVLRWCDGI